MHATNECISFRSLMKVTPSRPSQIPSIDQVLYKTHLQKNALTFCIRSLITTYIVGSIGDDREGLAYLY